ncbi:transposase [Streptomyces swartbergensis]|uniref:transposase n=1 Tax=Streptomyces swartbergensis TaxID=487165 RepID=UPI0013025DDD|nr:transposase [Streptomyces swartbergensis]
MITSLPSTDPTLGAEFLASTGGDMTVFGTADRLTGFGVLHPCRATPARSVGNLRRRKRGNRRLQGVYYASALVSIQYGEESAGSTNANAQKDQLHIQAVVALAA